MRCTAYSGVRARADPGTHPLRHRDSQGARKETRPPAWRASEIGPARAKGTGAHRTGPKLSTSWTRGRFEQKHRRGYRQAESSVVYNFNVLEQRAKELIAAGRPKDAMAIYLFMGDGDPSLDAGYLAMRMGECCENLKDLHAAKWWYGRAVEENPGIQPTRKHGRGWSISP
jgi:hypothetical protein